jgi:hypothetical protein
MLGASVFCRHPTGTWILADYQLPFFQFTPRAVVLHTFGKYRRDLWNLVTSLFHNVWPRNPEYCGGTIKAAVVATADNEGMKDHPPTISLIS